MKWHRGDQDSQYRAGAYTVERGPVTGPAWRALGPCVATAGHTTKASAQHAAFEAILARVGDPFRADVVVGDVVEYAGMRATITMATTTGDGTPLFCLRTTRGKRHCLLRSEFRLVVP
ncbi:hypothetical protein I5G63_gp096 [Mycobacterium phage Imvubu]|uniref:Uncharacterized protein n=1 Tax=Mycobacterium phage Imvubu TaxID=2686233 RepID=A0A6B9L7R7_9CAUD|nr:hypothetical protein I5G63_gp096 [Mycobacterium phage Imvubu]QHB37836.1 hypothetical protein PBI_IMVUBU_96 [Mycobacterium phage Imvubu]